MKKESNGYPTLPDLRQWLVFWGIVMVGMATADFASQWTDVIWIRGVLGWGAIAVTAVGVLVRLLRGGLTSASANGSAMKLLLPVAVMLGSVWLLDYVHAVDAFFAPMFRTLVLAVCFVYAGVSGFRSLMYVGLWLFAGACVLGIWYLGYAPLVLEGMSGLALLTAGWLLRGQQAGKEKGA